MAHSRRSATCIKPAPGQVTEAAGEIRAMSIRHRQNDAFTVVNRLLKAGEEAHFVGDRALAEHRRHRGDLRAGKGLNGRSGAEGGHGPRTQLHGLSQARRLARPTS